MVAVHADYLGKWVQLFFFMNTENASCLLYIPVFLTIIFLGYYNPLVFPSQIYQAGGYYHPQTYNAGLNYFYHGLNPGLSLPTCEKAILR